MSSTDLFVTIYWSAVLIGLLLLFWYLSKQKKGVPKMENPPPPMPIGGFKVVCMENKLQEKGKALLLLHPDDYKVYMEKMKTQK